MQLESKRTQEAQVIVLWVPLAPSDVRQLIVPFLKRGLGKTASLHSIGTSSRRAANTVKFVHW